MPRLARLRLIGIGHPNARFIDLVLDLRDAHGRATDATLWLRNGGGKSSLLNLFFSLVRPDRREFLGGRAEAKRRRIEDYVLANDRSAMIAEWELDGAPSTDEEPARILTGVFMEWRDGSGEERRLRRLFFIGRVEPGNELLSLPGVPLFIGEGAARRRRTLASFRQEWDDLRSRYPHAQLAHTDNLRDWADALQGFGLDPELFAYQVRMNQREGGADELFRFEDAHAFVDFLLELALDARLGEQVSRNVGEWRIRLRERVEQLQPERELIAGLIERLIPLDELARQRSAQQVRSERLGGDLALLERHLRLRIDALRAHEEKMIASRDAAMAAATTARDAAVGLRRHVAMLRVGMARRRFGEATERFDLVCNELNAAAHARDCWEAAVWLNQARRHEEAAAAHDAELKRKTAEHEPLRRDLEASGTRLSAGLRHRSAQLRSASAERHSQAGAAESEARRQNDLAGRAHAAAEAARRSAADLDRRIATIDAERSGLITAGVLGPEETVAQGLARIASADAQATAQAADALRTRAVVQQHRSELTADREQLSTQIGSIVARAEAEQRRLAAGEAQRHALEADTALRRLLGVEDLDLEHLGDQAVDELRTRARLAVEHIVDLRIEHASDERALLHLEEAGLLPPTRDVELVLKHLSSRLRVAWTGWAWIEANAPDSERRRSLVHAHPVAAFGVVVRDEDLSAARAACAELSQLPELPVAVVPQSALAGTGAPAFLIAGPASDAAFDKLAAQVELQRRRDRRGKTEHAIQTAEEERKAADDAARRLLTFREQWPRGRLGSLAIAVAELESEAARLRKLFADLQNRLQKLSAEEAAAEQVIETTAQLRRSLVGRSSRLEAFALREAERSEIATQAQAERTASAQHAAAESRARELAGNAGDRARTLRGEATGMGEDARALDEEERRVAHVDRAASPAPADLDRERDGYHRLAALYEQHIGADALTQLQRRELEIASKARSDLARALSDGLTEHAVAETLDTLPVGSNVEEQRRLAQERYASAMGLKGNQTQVVERHKRDLAATEKGCRDIGIEPPDHISLPEDPENEARVGENDALAADARAADFTKQAEDSGRQAGIFAAGHKALGKDLERLEEIPAAERVLPVGMQAEETWTPPVDDAVAGRIREVLGERAAIGTAMRALDDERRRRARDVRQWASRGAALRDAIGSRFVEAEDATLEAFAAAWSDGLRLRLRTIDETLAEVERHRALLVQEALSAANEAVDLLRSAATQSRLPAHLPRIGGAQFLRLRVEVPESPDEQRGRIAAFIDTMVSAGDMPDGLVFVQQALRSMVTSLSVRVLYPDAADAQHTLDIAEMGKCSGGEQLTGAILLYCTLAQLRARARGLVRRPSSVLILDNPIGRASRTRFLELQRDMARAMGVQLFYTTGVNDHEALAALPNLIRIRNQRVDRRTGHRLVEHDGEAGVEAVRVVQDEPPTAQNHGA